MLLPNSFYGLTETVSLQITSCIVVYFVYLETAQESKKKNRVKMEINKRKKKRENKIRISSLCMHAVYVNITDRQSGVVNLNTWINKILHSHKSPLECFLWGMEQDREAAWKGKQEQKQKRQHMNNQRACDVVLFLKFKGGAGRPDEKVVGWNPVTCQDNVCG